MKDTSVPWLGQVPKHWQPMRFAYLVEFRKGLSITKADLRDAGVPCVSYGEVHSKYAFEVNPEKHHLKCVEERFLTESPRSLLTNGDFVFADTSEDVAGSGNFTYLNSESRIFAGYHTIIARPKAPIHHRYLAYQLDTKAYRAQIQSQVSGVKVFSITKEILRNLVLYLPPLDEQRAIAAFLDYKTAQIDSLIDKKRRMIELLKEKRTALISHAVTKGLNPDAPMKDSGAPWLGQVPAHWEVKRLKFIFRNLNNIRIPLAAEERGTRQGEYPYYGASGIIDYVDDYLFDTPLILVAEDGANLLSRSTPLAFIASGKYWVNNHAHIIKPIYGNILYWESQLQVFDYTPLISGSAQPKLTRESLDNIWVAQPPSEEQDYIVKHMESQVTSIDSTSKQISKAISALQEYRSTIITAAVSGQIDVRNHGAA